jgi:hypothetical protein
VHKAKALIDRVPSLIAGDLFVFGAIKRTLAQCGGFRLLIEAKNFPCAAPILRMQIDTVMRVFAMTLVEDRGAFCDAVMEGQPINKLKSAEGKKLSDAYILSKLSEEYPWMKPIYARASGFIHLSWQHHLSAVAKMVEETGMIYLMLSETDPNFPETAYLEIVDTFTEVTKLAGIQILAYLMARGVVPDHGEGTDHAFSTG